MRQSIKRRISFALLGLLYGIILAFIGVISSGGGHFNLIAMMALAPFGLGLILWPALGMLISDLNSARLRYLFLCLLGIHYLGFIFYIYMNLPDELHWFRVGLTATSFIISSIAGILLYLVGNWFLWLRFSHSKAKLP